MFGHNEVQSRLPLSAPKLGIFTTFVLPLVGESFGDCVSNTERGNNQRGNQDGLWFEGSDGANQLVSVRLGGDWVRQQLTDKFARWCSTNKLTCIVPFPF